MAYLHQDDLNNEERGSLIAMTIENKETINITTSGVNDNR